MKAKKSKLSIGNLFLSKLNSNRKVISSALSFLLILVISINMGGILISGAAKYFSTNYWDRYQSLKNSYYGSVYADKNGGWPPDETLYAFNGGALITGTSPILVNPEIPPVGKYIVGLSILLFKNEHIIVFIFGIISLILMYLIGLQIFKTSLVSLIAPALISFEPFFKNQFIYTPLFDIFQLVFLLSSFYFFNKAFITNKKTLYWFFLSSLFIGLFISTKFFATGITIVAAFISVLILNKEVWKTFLFLMVLPVSIFILLLSYVRVLIIGYPFLKFLGIQKWVLWYNQGHLHSQFSIWPLLFLNIWYQADGRILSDPQWRLSWPLSATISGMVGISFSLISKIEKKGIEVLFAWSFFYLALLSLSDASARYLVILLPVLFMICVWGIEQIVYYILKRYEAY